MDPPLAGLIFTIHFRAVCYQFYCIMPAPYLAKGPTLHQILLCRGGLLYTKYCYVGGACCTPNIVMYRGAYCTPKIVMDRGANCTPKIVM